MEEKKKKKLPTWAIVLIVILGIGLVGSIANTDNDDNKKENSTSTQESTQAVKEEKKELTLEEGWTTSKDDYGISYYVEGYVTNPTDKDYSYVQIEFTAFDKEGNTLDTCLDNNSGLQKDGRWKFKAMCLSNADEIDRVEFKKLSGH